MEPAISVVIPTLNAASEIGSLLDALLSQHLLPSEVLVVDSSSDDATREVVCSYTNSIVRLHTIAREDFNHGLTRDMALHMTSGEYVLFLTQDAVPVSNCLTERVVAPMLADPKIAQVTGRQLPKVDARRFEQLVRGFNYPAESNVRVASDISRFGIKTYFSSDVCCCYRRSAYLAIGGFTATDMSEDMLASARLLAAGWSIAYAGDAEVRHSHNLTLRQQYARNHAVGVILERNAAELNCGSEVGEGMRLVGKVSKQLLREGHVGELCAFGADCIARLLGNRTGRRDIRKVLDQASIK